MGDTIRPLHNRILLKRHDEDTMSAGGLHIPEQARDRPLKATVVAVAHHPLRQEALNLAAEFEANLDAEHVPHDGVCEASRAITLLRKLVGHEVGPKPGDEVLIGRFAGIEVRHEGELLALVDEEEVVGICDEVGRPFPHREGICPCCGVLHPRPEGHASDGTVAVTGPQRNSRDLVVTARWLGPS